MIKVLDNVYDLVTLNMEQRFRSVWRSAFMIRKRTR